MKLNWYSKSAQDIAAILGSSLESGLSCSAAEQRLEEEGDNLIFNSEIPGGNRGIWGFIFDLSSLLLLLTAVICLFLSQFRLSVVISVLWAVNRLACGIAYLLGLRCFMSLRVRAMPRAKVVRVKSKSVPSVVTLDMRGIVRGDIVLLRRGDFVPCDARIIQCKNFSLDESALTGIATPSVKNHDTISGDVKLSEMANMVFAGTSVLSGEALALCVATGKDCEVVSKHGLLRLGGSDDADCSYQHLKSHSVSNSRFPTATLCRIQGIAVILLAFAACVFALGYGLFDSGLFLIFVSAACAASASMNELLFAGWNLISGIMLSQLSKSSSGGDEALILSPGKLTRDGGINSVIISLSMLAGHDELEATTLVTPTGEIINLANDLSKSETTQLRIALATLGKVMRTPATEALSRLNWEEKYLPKNARISQYKIKGRESMTCAFSLGDSDRCLYVMDTPESILPFSSTLCDSDKSIPLSDTTRGGLMAIAAHYHSHSQRVFSVAKIKDFDPSHPDTSKAELLGFFVLRMRRNVGADEFLQQTITSGTRLRIMTELAFDAAKPICSSLGLDMQALKVYEPKSPSQKITEEALGYGLYCALTRHQKHDLLALIKKYEGACAVISNLPEDSKLLLESDISLTPASFKMSATQNRAPRGYSSLICSADVLTGESPRAAGRVLSRAKTISTAIANSACLLCTTQLCRILWFAISLVVSGQAPAPAGVLFLGVAWDLAAVLLIAFRASQKHSVRIVRSPLEIFKFLSYALVWTIINTTACAFLRLLSIECDISALGFISLLIFTPLVCVLATYGEGKRDGIKFSLWHLLYLSAGLGIAVLASMVPSAYALIGAGEASVTILAASAVTAVLSFMLSAAIASLGASYTSAD